MQWLGHSPWLRCCFFSLSKFSHLPVSASPASRKRAGCARPLGIGHHASSRARHSGALFSVCCALRAVCGLLCAAAGLQHGGRFSEVILFSPFKVTAAARIRAGYDLAMTHHASAILHVCMCGRLGDGCEELQYLAGSDAVLVDLIAHYQSLRIFLVGSKHGQPRHSGLPPA